MNILKHKEKQMRKTITVLAITPFLSAASYLYAHGTGEGSDRGPHMMGPWMMWGHETGWFWPFIMIVFWITAIVGIVFLIRWVMSSSGGRNQTSGAGESALDLLKKRYARGEISRDEYEQIKKDIS